MMFRNLIHAPAFSRPMCSSTTKALASRPLCSTTKALASRPPFPRPVDASDDIVVRENQMNLFSEATHDKQENKEKATYEKQITTSGCDHQTTTPILECLLGDSDRPADYRDHMD